MRFIFTMMTVYFIRPEFKFAYILFICFAHCETWACGSGCMMNFLPGFRRNPKWHTIKLLLCVNVWASLIPIECANVYCKDFLPAILCQVLCTWKSETDVSTFSSLSPLYRRSFSSSHVKLVHSIIWSWLTLKLH